MAYDIYRFGPYGDITLRFISRAKREYLSYDALKNEDKLILQLVCHAVLQIGYSESNPDYTKVEKQRKKNKWFLKCSEQDEYYTWEKNKIGILKPLKKTAVFTCAAYDLIYEGELILSMCEGIDYNYEIVILQMKKLGECADSILESALKHAEQYGRR